MGEPERHVRVSKTGDSIRTVVAVVRLVMAEGKRVSLFNDAPAVFKWGYRFFWVVGAVIVLFLPTFPEEPLIYFPALLAVATAWLFVAPAYGQALLDADYRPLAPGNGFFKAVREAFRHAGLPVNEPTAEDEAKGLEVARRMAPDLVRQTVVGLFLGFKYEAYLIAFVSIIGLLSGLALQHVHLVRGWSPVSILYAISAPSVVPLLFSLALPMVTQQYLAALKLHQAGSESTKGSR